MNGDSASRQAKADMSRWGVNLDYVECAPQCNTPIIVQEIRHEQDGSPKHRFIWNCPNCGEHLPNFKPITKRAFAIVSDTIEGADVFLLDRVSRGALMLAKQAAEAGAIVFFEPSGVGNAKLFKEALALAHVIKYAQDRINELDLLMPESTSILVEIQTLGATGLRVRDRLQGRRFSWRHLEAVTAPVLVDTCGTGDWCSAGLVSKAFANGLRGLIAGGHAGLDDALHFGQLLAAWSCGFEGARGGMHASQNREEFEKQISSVRSGKAPTIQSKSWFPVTRESISCPACPRVVV